MANHKKQKNNYTTFWLNLVFLLLAFAFVKGSVLNQQGYSWVYGMLKGNMKTIKQYPNLTLPQRSEVKMGGSYSYYKYIADNTPKNAVIYIPARDAFFPKGQQSMFTGEPYNKMWAIRFLYPRKVVVPQEMGHSIYSRKLTHIAIVNGVGLEMLSYSVSPNFRIGVLPINNKEILKQTK